MSDLITQLSDAITTATTLCAEIKKTRHVGKSHTQLDLLEASLAAGPSTLNLSSSSLSISDDAKSGLEGYISQVGEINARLDHIAHPKKHGHGHGHHHHQKSLLFPDLDPGRHEHKELEDPHFGELRTGWEKIRDGVEKLLEGKGKKEEGGAVEEVTEELEVKLEIKETVKEESKDEVKAEVKEDMKEDVKSEVKEEVKITETKEASAIKVDEVEQVKA